MVESAPRLDPRLVAGVRFLHDPRESMGETTRRLGALASDLGLPRPSYSQVRRLVLAERRRRAESHERLDRIAVGLIRHEHPYDLFGRR